MKKLILSICFIALIAVACLQQGCRKPKCPQPDPCKDPVTVMAVTPEYYLSGHFMQSIPGQGDVYLYAENWGEYSTQVIPGRQYALGYKEVPCNDKRARMECGIAPGGCVIYPNKCIRIICLKEITDDRVNCSETVINPVHFDPVHSQMVGTKGISGHTLDATVSFSGCGPDDKVNFKLYVQRLNIKSNSGHDIWLARPVNLNTGITCQAVFSKQTCFELSPIKSFYTGTTQLPPAEVIVRVETAAGLEDLIYKF